jgi:hypothetical protein
MEKANTQGMADATGGGGSRFYISSETILPRAAAESASRYPWLKAAGILGQ